MAGLTGFVRTVGGHPGANQGGLEFTQEGSVSGKVLHILNIQPQILLAGRLLLILIHPGPKSGLMG